MYQVSYYTGDDLVLREEFSSLVDAVVAARKWLDTALADRAVFGRRRVVIEEPFSTRAELQTARDLAQARRELDRVAS